MRLGQQQGWGQAARGCGCPLRASRVCPRSTEAVEKAAMLRTRAMREKEEQREMRKYSYTLLRVRFPDGFILQGEEAPALPSAPPAASLGAQSEGLGVRSAEFSSWNPPKTHWGDIPA